MDKETLRKKFDTLLQAYADIPVIEREKLLKECVTQDITFSIPMAEKQGFDTLVKDVTHVQELFPGASFKCTQFFAHHGQFLGDRTMYDKDGKATRAGYTYGRYNDDGLFTSMTGFFEG